MNQILSVDNEKSKKTKGPADINAVIKIFIILLIIFAICIIGIAIYSMVKNNEISKKFNETIPQIYVKTTQNNNSIILNIVHDKEIKEVVYSWNEENEQKIEGNNRKNIEERIEVPEGTNTLFIKAIDVKGKTSEQYKKEFKNGGTNISFKAGDNNVKIILESTKKISFIKYKWDDNQENKIDINNTKFEKEIEMLKGEHTLTVVAVDENNNTETATTRVLGITRPKIEVKQDNKEYYLIKVTDEKELKKVEIITEEGTETKEVTGKEFNYKIQLKENNDNKMIIRAYNSNDEAMAEKKVKCRKD